MMLTQVRKLLKLSFAEFRILLAALFLLPSIAFALKFKGFQWTKSFLEKSSSKIHTSPRSVGDQLQDAQIISWLVSAAAYYGPYHANCLKRTLAAWWLLNRRGIETEIKIGANLETGNFKAHSWLEFHGTVLADRHDVDDHFSTFDFQQLS